MRRDRPGISGSFSPSLDCRHGKTSLVSGGNHPVPGFLSSDKCRMLFPNPFLLCFMCILFTHFQLAYVPDSRKKGMDREKIGFWVFSKKKEGKSSPLFLGLRFLIRICPFGSAGRLMWSFFIFVLPLPPPGSLPGLRRDGRWARGRGNSSHNPGPRDGKNERTWDPRRAHRICPP